jgi:DNA-binding YbaB/EbfC family protein
MFGKIGDMLGKLQEVKKKVEEIKAKLETEKIDVTGASGDIKITINGNRKIQKLEIADALQHGAKDELQEQLLSTINKAIEAADQRSADEMKTVAGGLIPPGLL